MPEFAERFETETGITLQVISVSSGQGDARVAAEKDNPQADVAISGSNPADTNPDLYRPFEGAVDVSNVDERWIRGDYSIPTILNSVIFATNTEVLDGRDAPTSWEDLGDPQWKGEIAIADPTQSGSAFNALAAVYAAGGWPLVEKFASNVVISQSSLGPIQALSNGEAAIGIGAENSVYQVADGTDIVAAYPTDGIVVNVGMFYLLANSNNEEAANAFMEWMLSTDTQTWMEAEHKGMRSTTTNSTSPSGMPALSTLNIIDVPADVLEDKAAFLDEWTEILTSVG
ncbi:ABC transporter substrate-binding protein [Microbacterium caowuchunii]|nr:extracellular solute-binding protein [Microbacterium caowuchunii]